MPFISREILRLALESLREAKYSPLLIVSVPCMEAKGIPTCVTPAEAQTEARPFGSVDERRWLGNYFSVAGGPPGKPYYMPATDEWVEERYAERSLQRRRTDFVGTVFFHPDTARWAFTADAAAQLRERVLKKLPPVKLVALMAWMWRFNEINSLAEAVEDFIDATGLRGDDMLMTVYDPIIPDEFTAAGLAPERLTHEDVAELVGATPPPPPAPQLHTTVATLEQALRDAHFIAPSGLVSRIVGGWMVGDIVVLVGTTGSGKTSLARALGKGFERLFPERFISSFIEISPDFDAAQFIGYENLAGEFTAGRFTKEVLFVGSVTDPRLIVLDEWNLAQIDSYFAPVLSVIESRQPLRLPGRVQMAGLDDDAHAELTRAQPGISSGQVMLPENSFFLATCNSWSEEPETRLPISGPVKRRCRIIPMPNALLARYAEKKQDGIIETCNTLLDQERSEVDSRAASGHQNVFDDHRVARLDAIPQFSALDGVLRGKLLQVVKLLLDNPLTRDGFTPGILRDVLLSCVYAEDGLAAFGEEVADKILHQVRNDPKVLEAIVEVCKDLPNAAEIQALARRMGAFSGERRTRPLI